MGDEDYHMEVKRVPNEGRIKRMLVNPIVRIAKWKVDEPKKDRVSA